MTSSPLVRLRRLCLALPESHEVMAWGAETFRVKNKLFAMYSSAESGHSGGRNGVWIKATADNQRLMIATWPTRFFVPPYVGPSGWIGVWLDDGTDWDEVVELLRDAWLRTAPKKLAAAMTRDEALAARPATTRDSGSAKPTTRPEPRKAAPKKTSAARKKSSTTKQAPAVKKKAAAAKRSSTAKSPARRKR